MNESFSKRIIFFDDLCVLCNRSVHLILRFDKKGIFHFASLHSETAKNILPSDPETDSILYFEDGKIYQKSNAVFKITRQLSYLKYFYAFAFLPKKITDNIYDLIARNRYGIFGKYDQCPIAPPQHKSRFLS